MFLLYKKVSKFAPKVRPRKGKREQKKEKGREEGKKGKGKENEKGKRGLFFFQLSHALYLSFNLFLFNLISLNLFLLI